MQILRNQHGENDLYERSPEEKQKIQKRIKYVEISPAECLKVRNVSVTTNFDYAHAEERRCK